ncbi:MAG: GTPase ObgE [Fimbriimonadaceae bacterium]|nr:GTPase ObgE [Fimbriimonadaceae bacterium]
MSLIDEVEALFISGKGGDGAATFHREKHVPRGGPNGADGGKGGDIILMADRGVRTLYDVQLHGEFRAGDGANANANKRGKDGKSLTIRVPIGTIITDVEVDEPLVDLGADGMRYRLCRGGRGGAGNLRFVNSVRQVPRFAMKGEPGEALRVRLELKMLADVGLVGLPNAGKSTLLSVVSRAKPKIGAYPFTTLSPNLGVAKVGDRSFVIADLPGLIEGAGDGVGLGHRFLKHTERTKVLVHVVDGFPIDESDPWQNYLLIEEEIRRYSPELHARPRVIAINKIDMQSMGDLPALLKQFEQAGHPVFAVSGAAAQGLEPLLFHLDSIIQEAESQIEPLVITPPLERVDENLWEIHRDADEFVVTGKRVERWVNMTDLENRDAVRHLHRRLERSGIIARLREMGAQDGDNVVIDNWEFTFSDW